MSLPCTHSPHSWTVSRGGVHTQDAVEAPSTLGPELSAPPNSLMAVRGPSGVGGSCGVRVGWAGVLPGSPLGAARDPMLSRPEANLPTTSEPALQRRRVTMIYNTQAQAAEGTKRGPGILEHQESPTGTSLLVL